MIEEDWLAKEIDVTVVAKNEKTYSVRREDTLFLLAKREGQRKIDEEIHGFAYRNRQDQAVFTSQLPIAGIDKFGWSQVVEVRRDLGVFVNIGLEDKDIAVSLDDFPEEKKNWPQKGDELLIKLDRDKKGRLWGKLAWHQDFLQLSRPAYSNMQNQDLTAIVYRIKESGVFLYLPDNNMLGFIHPNELEGPLRIGQRVTTRVIGFRSQDKILNLSAKARNFEKLNDDSAMLLAYLEANGGHMSFTDKSTPEEIKQIFGISKGQFKKALGGLMKEKKVRQNSRKTELIKR